MALVAKGVLGDLVVVYRWQHCDLATVGSTMSAFCCDGETQHTDRRCRRRDFGVKGCRNDVRSVAGVVCRVGAARDCRTYLVRGGCRRCRMRRCRCQREEDPPLGGGCLAWRRLSHSWRAHAPTIGAL